MLDSVQGFVAEEFFHMVHSGAGAEHLCCVRKRSKVEAWPRGSADTTAAVEYVRQPKALPKNVLTHRRVRKMLSSVPLDTPKGYRT